MTETGKGQAKTVTETGESFSLKRRADSPQNVALAQAIRAILAMREGSWEEVEIVGGYQGVYTKRPLKCIKAVVGDDPIGLILECLFAAGYDEMWEFCDRVLGPRG